MGNKPWSPPPRFLFRKHNALKALNKLNGVKTFVDVGCGAGGMACILVKEAGLKGSGIDFSRNAIFTAENLKKSLGLKKYPEFQLVDGKNFKDIGKADLVTCFEVLEHVADDTKLLKDLKLLSKKYVMISVPAKQKLFSRSDELAGHFRRYEKKELAKMLEDNGLKIVNFVSYGYPYTNIVRLIREQFSKSKKHEKNSQSMEQRSKKSGVDLFNINRFIPNLERIIKALYHTSRVFNGFDLAEGYLVTCEFDAGLVQSEN